MLKSRKELMVVTENHGGYLSGLCALCGDSGWIDEIEHKPGCLLFAARPSGDACANDGLPKPCRALRIERQI